MRKSKTKKQVRNAIRAKSAVTRKENKKALKTKLLEAQTKMQAWRDLPVEQWSAARAARVEAECLADEVAHAVQYRKETLEELV